MATAAPALYRDEPYEKNFSLIAGRKETTKTTERSQSSISLLARASMLVAAGVAPGVAYAGESEVPIVIGGEFFVDHRAHLIEALRQYEQLEAGWDGNDDDVVPSVAAINEAIQFVEKLPPFVALPEPMVSNDGEVGLFWHDDELYLDVGFRGGDECSYFGKIGDEKIKRRDPISESAPIPSALLDFLVKLSDGEPLPA